MFCRLKYFFTMEKFITQIPSNHFKSWCAKVILEPLKGFHACLCLKTKQKNFPWNQGISLHVGKFIFHFAIFCNSLIFLILFQRISFFIRIIYMPHTFSSNYSFIANYLHEEIKKRKNHISLRVGKFPRFDIFNFPMHREIRYASVQSDWLSSYQIVSQKCHG